MKRFAVLLLLLTLITGCAAQAITTTTTTAPTTTNTVQPTATATKTFTPTPTEKPRFENLLPGTIEEVMAENVIRPEFYQRDLALFVNKMRQNIHQDAQCPNYGYEVIMSVPENRMQESKITIDNPLILGTAYFNIEDREFLFVGACVKSHYADSSDVVVFALDLDMNSEVTEQYKQRGFEDFFNNNMSLTYNNQTNYKKLVKGEVSVLEARVAISSGGVNETSEDKNLLWFHNYNDSMSEMIQVDSTTSDSESEILIATFAMGASSLISDEFMQQSLTNLGKYPIPTVGFIFDAPNY